MSTTVVNKSITPKRIILVGDGDRQFEAIAGGTIRPGDLVAIASDGTVVKHPTAGGWAEHAFAVEDALQGNGIEDNYAAAARVTYVIAESGDTVYAWLSGGEVATLGSYLTSNGDGALKVASGSDIRIAKALDALDASDSNDVDERIRVRIL